MRVCHVTILHPRGDQRILFRECRSLALAGYDVHLIAPPSEHQVACPGVTIHTGPRLSAKWRVLLCTWQVFRLARREVRAEVYHFHDFWLIPFGLMITWFSKSAAVYDVHEEYSRATARSLETRTWAPAFVRRSLERIVNALETFGARRFVHVITVVDSITDRFRRVTPHVTEVRNYVRRDLLPADPPTREQYLARPPVVIHQGTLSALRGSDLMLRTARVMKDRGVPCTFWLVDRFLGDDQARRRFLTHLEELGIADCVEVKPPVMYEEIGKYLMQSRIGLSLRVLPTGYDAPTALTNIPTKLFEYMGFGLPIVAIDVNFHSIFLRETGAGILTEYEENSVADALERLLNHPDLAYRMGCDGFRAYQQKYTWDSQETCLLEAYRDIARRREPSTEGAR